MANPTFATELEEFAPPLAQFQSLPSNIGKQLVTGAVIIRRDSTDSASRVLLVQRAERETMLPLHWEIPGGKVDLTDVSLLDGLAREVLEETGLLVTRFLTHSDDFEYTTKRGVSKQYNFLIEVGEGEVKLNDREHRACAWISCNELAEIEPITVAMRRVVANAFGDVKLHETQHD